MRPFIQSGLLVLLSFFGTVSVMGQIGNYLQLDGLTGYVQVPDHEDLDVGIGEDLTITLWLRSSQFGDFPRILHKRVIGAGTGYELMANPTGNFAVNFENTQNINVGSPAWSEAVILDGNWHHLAMVVNTLDYSNKLYIDGDLATACTRIDTQIGSTDFSNNIDLYFGYDTDYNTYFHGSLDELRYWSFPMTMDEILEDMGVPLNGDEPGLIAAWDFENTTSDLVPDLTGLHNGSIQGGATVIDSDAPMQYVQTTLFQREIPAGIGAMNQGIVGVNIQTSGFSNPLTVSAINVTLDGSSDLNDIDQVHLYYTGETNRFSEDVLYGSSLPSTGEVEIAGEQTLNHGDNHFWITVDVALTASEGDLLDAGCVSVVLDEAITAVSPSDVDGSSPILLEHKVLFSGGDYGSGFFRIPAITTATDGALVVITDARYNSSGDLPNDIDLMVRRSEDHGATWSDASILADFGTSGAGDACLVTDKTSGDLISLFPSHNGFFQSTPSNRIRMQMTRSADNGVTWSTPVNISDMIYGPGWHAVFVTSGAMHQMESGRIVAAAVVRPGPSTTLSGLENYMIYSDDGGYTWDYMPNPASTSANEAKLVELVNGDLMMNIRAFNNRKIAISHDGGQSWDATYMQEDLIDPFVNGELIRYTSVNEGFDQNRLLFSIAASTTRENMTVFLSYDEGDTWSVSKVIYPGPAAYSALTVLDDGTIGLFYENGEYETYQMYFARFSLGWLTDGADTWLPSQVTEFKDDDAHFHISPNPTTGPTSLTFTLKQPARIRGYILDERGAVVDTLAQEPFPAGRHTVQINLGHLPAAYYFIELHVADQKTAQKIVLIK
ncbi:MAG: exo-alpha-sialidase [Flavobacteriales bacterium]|nr:exo-alpha-sialidase [Flavobacteriales bacterium]